MQNQLPLEQLRHQHPRFHFQSYQVAPSKEGLQLSFTFFLEPDIYFHPQVNLVGVTPAKWSQIPSELQKHWAFHLGLAEIPSYWKAAASPEIVIEAGYLNQDQLNWWEQLLIKGMGEYFYRNQIDFTQPDFVHWRVANVESVPFTTSPQLPPPIFSSLVPVGGGKDSALSLCLLEKYHQEFGVFLLNPTQAMRDISSSFSPTQVITAHRTIDPKLLELNAGGYLNGHVPFSAYLGFLSRFAAVIFGYRSVLISNERSSNEGNVFFHHQEINHQWSKTFEFERLFETYLTQNQLVPFVSSDLEATPANKSAQSDILPSSTQPSYFSLLRPLYELQISQLLANCNHFPTIKTQFRSCNRGQKTDSWCGNCPKCLFTYVSLYPFVKTEELIAIFGRDLFENEALIDEARALTGVTPEKPFECVGTHEESIVAFYLSDKKYRHDHQVDGDKIYRPVLLQIIFDQVLSQQTNLDQRAKKILTGWNEQHQLKPELEDILQTELQQVEHFLLERK